MKNILLGNTGLEVSRIGMGVLAIGPNQRNLPLKEGADVISHAFDKGINLIDTAQYYRAYPYIRRALSSGRHKAVVCSKSLAADYEGMSAAIEEARRALDTDVIDIFLMHEVRAGQFEERAGAWECLCDAKARGIIRAAGVSTHNVDVTMQMAGINECDVVFSLINYAGLGIRLGGRPGTAREMEEALRLCRNMGKGTMSMKAFGGGNLTLNYQKALGYALSLRQVDSVMIGFSSAKEIDDAVSFFDGKLPASYNPDVSEKKMWIEEDSCEGCGLCRAACQSEAIYYSERGLARIDEKKCLTCGYCAPVCPVRAIIMI